jgi:hypothetical protein
MTSQLVSDKASVLEGYRVFYKGEFPEVRFSENTWDFSRIKDRGYFDQKTPQADFSKISSEENRLTAKELCYLLLNPQNSSLASLPQRRQNPLPLGSVYYRTLVLRHWFEWLENLGITSLRDVNQDHCSAYLAERKEELATGSLISMVILPLRELALYTPFLTNGYQEGFFPWEKSSVSDLAGSTSAGNSTPWIPEEVFDPLLAGSLFYIDQASEDILAAHRELKDLRSKPINKSTVGLDKALENYIFKLKKDGRSLPKRDARRTASKTEDELGEVNFNLLERQLGIKLRRSHLTKTQRKLLTEAAKNLGVEDGGLSVKPSLINIESGEKPWRDSFNPTDVRDELRRLVTSCFVVIAGLSGMRATEIYDLRNGCIEEISIAEDAKRYRIQSRLYKHQDLGGEETKWTVIEPVVRAVQILEELSPDKDSKLFRRIWFDKGQERLPEFKTLLRSFVRWQNAEGQKIDLPAIPDISEQPWDFTTRQFRRTLARQLAFRPHGTIASKVHLKHISATISEGYWGPRGESVEQFLGELDEAEQEARVANIQKQYQSWEQGEKLSGGASKKLIEDFMYVQGELESFQGTLDQRNKRVVELLKRRTDTLHIGHLNDCHFIDPSRARCLKKAGVTDSSKPLLNVCQPSKCANALITKEHKPRWEEPLLQIEDLLQERQVPKHEKARLREEKTRIETIIKPLEKKK